MRKQEIKNLVIEGLVDGEIFSYDALEYVKETTSALKLRQLELEYELKLEQARIEQSQKEKELELQREKNRMEHEVRLREIDLASQPKVVKSDNPQFDASKNIKRMNKSPP